MELPHLDPPGGYHPPSDSLRDSLERETSAWLAREEAYRASNNLPRLETNDEGMPYTRAPKRARRSSTPSTTLSKPAKTAVTKLIKTCMFREAEMKHSTTSDSFTPSATGTLGTSVVALGQGTTSGTRVGNQVRLLHLNFRIIVSLPAAAVGDIIRCILVQDHQPNGTAYAVTDVLETANLNALYNMDKVGGAGGGRFSILVDRQFTLVPTSAIVATGTALVYRALNSKVKRSFNIDYQAAAGTVSDLVRNNVQWMAISNVGVAAFGCKTQFCYVDV